MPHAVALQKQQLVQRRSRRVLEVVGAIKRGRAIQVGRPDPLHRLKIVLIEILTPVEHQVLEQVSEPGPPRLLILRPDVVPHVHGDNRRLPVLMHKQRQAVLQNEFLIRNLDLNLTGRLSEGGRRQQKT